MLTVGLTGPSGAGKGVIASLLAGGAIGGLVGMLLAVPVGAFLKMQFEKWLAKKEPPKDSDEEE